MSIITDLTRMWLTRSAKPFLFQNEYDQQLPFSQCEGLGLYVHIPFCRELCGFCPYCKVQYDRAVCDRYLDRLIREIHDYLLSHMDQRITIEGLCHLYPINPTTLKEVFKDVYGTSIAAHLKEHRMEKAARLLRETDASMAEVARRGGYESQSKFTAAFKDQYGCLPTMYRKMS